MIRLLVCAIVAAAISLVPALAQTAPTSREAIRLSFAPIVKQAAPAVVNVFSRRVVRTSASPFADDPFFRRFFGDRAPFGLPQERVQNSLGSGVIIDPDGLIVTNHHVIQDSQEITVVLSDRREFEARVLRSDERTDLAVLKIDPKDERLPTLEIGDSDALQVGDLVLAVGNPFGVGQTVTSGIVSGLARTAIGISDFRSFIQTDAAINPGNSGGALVDVDGKLVGINTAIYSRSGGSIGLGFAIPTSMVRAVVEGARTGKPIARAWLGATGQPVTAEIAQATGLDRPRGVLVKEVAANSPAAQAGVRAGDVIIGIAGHDVDDPEDLRFRVATLPVSAPVQLVFWRSGKQQEASATLVTPPEIPARDTQTLEGHHPLTGVTVSNLNPALDEELSLDMAQRGVVIEDVRDGSYAQRIGLQKGDVLVSLNGKPLPNVASLRQVVTAATSPWSLSVKRGNQTLSVTVRG
ncbi:MAG TPA: DegQ family serine endoprotease [Stellaceae bacterium]|nr:DegQ family serine endoprotease [Stellaceae bacterium]